MAIAAIQRRVRRLQGLEQFAPVIEYLPLTSPEIEAIANRVQAGEPLTREEVDRVRRLSPIVDGVRLVLNRLRQVRRPAHFWSGRRLIQRSAEQIGRAHV